MNDQLSATVDLGTLLRALVSFEVDAGVISVKVRLTIDDRATLTIEPASPGPITIEGE